MSAPSKGPIILAIMIITVGVGWLLAALGYAPGINWVWTLCLGALGILTFVMSGGVDKVSIVVGPFFLASSLLSVLRQTGKIKPEVEVPVLVITMGVLLLVAQLPAVPMPSWFTPLPRPSEDAK